MKHLSKIIYFLPLLILAGTTSISALGQTYTSAEKIFVTTDRYFYSPGERLHFTVFVVNENNQLQKESSMIKVLLVDAKDKAMDSLVVHLLSGRFSYFFNLPQKGGMLKIKASTRWQLNELKPKTFEKEIYIQEQIQRSFFIKQELAKTSYVPGDTVSSDIHITKRGNEGISGGYFTAYLITDDKTIDQQNGWLDNEGKAHVRFGLPNVKIKSAYIKIASEFQGTSEFAMTRIPILTKDISMVAFTEMGTPNLVAEEANKIVIHSFDNLGNPKDIKGQIVDQFGKVVKNFESFHKGMAEVIFVPQKGLTYAAVSNLAKEDALLPPVHTDIPYVHVYEFNGRLVMESRSKQAHQVDVRIVGNDKVVMEKTLVPQPNQKVTQAQISLQSLPPGVYGIKFTSEAGDIYGKQLYVRRPDGLNINIKPNKKIVSLGQAVKLNINTAGEAASFAVRVISEQNIKQIKDRSHSIVSWMYLGSELTADIEEPTFYFDEKNDKSLRALNLLSIVYQHAWRRDFNNGKLTQNPENVYPRVSSYFSGSIYQYNVNTQQLSGIKVRLKQTNYVTETDSLGRFSFSGIPSVVLSNNPILIVSRGIERLEYPIHQSYNYYNHGFSESIKPGAIGMSIRDIKKLEIQYDRSGWLNYRSPMRSDLSGSLDVLELNRDIDFTSSDQSASYMTSVEMIRPLAIPSLKVASYSWYFGYYGGNYRIYEDEYSTYTVPFGVVLDHNYRSNPITYAGPIRLGDKTTYWNAEVQSNDQGDCKMEFYTPFKNDGMIIFCEGVTKSGKVFCSQEAITVQDEIEIFTNIPTTLTVGDFANIELKCINHTDEAQTLNYTLVINGKNEAFALSLAPKQTKNIYAELQAGSKAKQVSFKYYYNYEKVQRNSENYIIPVLPKGHARNLVVSGNNTSSKQIFEVNEVIEGTADLQLSIMNDFVELLESTSKRMIRQPNGCFEQVSSSNYPNLLALKVLQKKSSYVQSDLINKIQMGYNKLAAYETPSHGFEWYGRNPPHTTLSAYGLLQFSLTRELGLQINEAMFNRNLEWLMKQRDGEGGFDFHRGKYGFSRSGYETNNAYVTWVLSRLSQKNISTEIQSVVRDLDKDYDAYKAALLAGIFANKGMTDEANQVLKKLENHVETSGYMNYKTKGSIMYSSGRSLDVEIMALTLLATYKLDPTPGVFASKLISVIMASQTNYGFGNTQSTALALEALSNYSDFFISKSKNQQYTVWLDNKAVLTWAPAKESKTVANILLTKEQFQQGQHNIKVTTEMGKQLPYTLELTWLEEIEKVEHDELAIDYAFDKNEVTTSEPVLAHISIQNKTDVDKPQTVAVIHLPAGTSYSMDELRLLKKEGVFDYFETIQDQLIFYFLGLEANETRQIHLALTPNVYGRFSPAESYVYQYYTPEIRSSILAKPLNIKQEIRQ